MPGCREFWYWGRGARIPAPGPETGARHREKNRRMAPARHLSPIPGAVAPIWNPVPAPAVPGAGRAPDGNARSGRDSMNKYARFYKLPIDYVDYSL